VREGAAARMARRERHRAIEEAVRAGATAAQAGVDVRHNPHFDFELGCAWALAWHAVHPAPAPPTILLQAKLAGVRA
jgi:hypothetical protein